MYGIFWEEPDYYIIYIYIYIYIYDTYNYLHIIIVSNNLLLSL